MATELEENIYICQLDETTVNKAKNELREDVETRNFALKQMRNWIEKNARIIHCRTDANFLLRFLRAKKFSLPLAQEALERYILLRQVYGDLMFFNLDVERQFLSELTNLGYIFAVPNRDSEGRRIIITRPGVFDPHKYINEHMCHMHAMTYEALMEDEQSQVTGFVHIADGQGFSFPHLTLFTPREAVRIVKNGERIIPMRHKEVHGINVPSGLKYVVDFGLNLISEKIRNRVQIHDTIENLHKFVDKKLLPKEYGGEMPMAEMLELWRKELLSKRETLLSNDKMQVQLELYSEAAREGRVSALKYGCAADSQNDHVDCVTGSFRQLTVD